MKSLILFLFGVLVHLKIGESSIPLAIHQIVQKFFETRSATFEIIFNRQDLPILDDVIGRVMNQSSVQLRLFQRGRREYFELNNSAVILFDSFRNYKVFENALYIHEHKVADIDLFIYCADLTTKVLRLNLPDDDYQIRTYLTEDTNGMITLQTRSLFTSQRCFWPQLVGINEFSRPQNRWTTNEFTTSTLTNFHGCKLMFGVGQYIQGARLVVSEDSKSTSLIGYHIGMIKALASHLNFKLDYSLIFGGNFNKSFCVLNLSTVVIERTNFYRGATSPPIFSSSLVVAVPPGRPYTPLEKLFLPFDESIWMYIGVVFLAAFAVIALIVQFKLSSLYEIVIDWKVTTPAFNVFGIAMGIGQTVLPNRHSARILLTTFLLFNLVLRTAYQGKYFDLLVTNSHKPPIQTIDELIELQQKHQYKVFMMGTSLKTGGLSNFFQDLEIMKR